MKDTAIVLIFLNCQEHWPTAHSPPKKGNNYANKQNDAKTPLKESTDPTKEFNSSTYSYPLYPSHTHTLCNFIPLPLGSHMSVLASSLQSIKLFSYRVTTLQAHIHIKTPPLKR